MMLPTSTDPLAASTRIKVASPSGPRSCGVTTNVTSVGCASIPATASAIASFVGGRSPNR